MRPLTSRVVVRFQIPRLSNAPSLRPLFDLCKVELDGSRASEDRDLDLELLLVGFDLFDRPREVRERAVDDADLVAGLERDARLRLHGPLDDDLAKIVDLRRLHFLRPLIPDEFRDLGGLLHEVPGLLAHLHLDEDVAGEAVLLADARLAARALLLNRLG